MMNMETAGSTKKILKLQRRQQHNPEDRQLLAFYLYVGNFHSQYISNYC